MINQKSRSIVTLTSYGKRIDKVHLAIQSILKGESLPGKIILWLPQDSVVSKELTELKKSGLDILFTKDYLSYTKLYPLAKDKSLWKGYDKYITADDDMYYPHNWLKNIEEKYEKLDEKDKENALIACRAHKITLTESKINVYNDFLYENAKISDSSELIFPTSGHGLCIPKRFLQSILKYQDSFLDIAPKADDVWWWAIAVKENFSITLAKEISMRSSDYIMTSNSTVNSLSEFNWKKVKDNSTNNDIAIAKCMSYFNITLDN